MFEYETLVDPLERFSSFNTRIHCIEGHHVVGQPCYGDVHATLDAHLAGRTTVAHSYFDKGALSAACRVHGHVMIDTTWLDSVCVAKRAGPELGSHKLSAVSRHLGIALRHHDALSDARAAGMIVVHAIDQTGIPLEGWLTGSSRRAAPAPKPALDGPLKSERVAILGEAKDGPLAKRIAAAGGRVMSSVGATTTILAVIGEEPFGYVRYDAQFRLAEEMRRSGQAIRILSSRAIERLAA